MVLMRPCVENMVLELKTVDCLVCSWCVLIFPWIFLVSFRQSQTLGEIVLPHRMCFVAFVIVYVFVSLVGVHMFRVHVPLLCCMGVSRFRIGGAKLYTNVLRCFVGRT